MYPGYAIPQGFATASQQSGAPNRAQTNGARPAYGYTSSTVGSPTIPPPVVPPSLPNQPYPPYASHPYPAGVPSTFAEANTSRPPLPYTPVEAHQQTTTAPSIPPYQGSTSASSTSRPAYASPPSRPTAGPSREDRLAPLRAPLAEIGRRLQLKDKSAEELEKLLDDESAFLEYIVSLPVVKTVRDALKEQEELNEQIAKATLAMEERVQSLHTAIGALQSKQSALQATYTAAKQENDRLCASLSIPGYIAAQRQLVDACEAKSDKLAEEWQSGTSTLDLKDFIRQFRELRQQYHYQSFVLQWLHSQQPIK